MECKLTRVPIPSTTIAQAIEIDFKRLSRAMRLIQSKLGLKLPTDDPRQYVGMIAGKLNIPALAQLKANKILKIMKEKRVIGGLDPLALAAAALYVAISQKEMYVKPPTLFELSMAAERSEKTIRKRIRLFLNYSARNLAYTIN